MRERRTRMDVRLFGNAGSPLKFVGVADGETVEVRSDSPLVPAERRALDTGMLREQLGRLGDTPFVLGTLDDAGLATGLFLPVRELNHLRQRAASELMLRRDWAEQARAAERSAAVDSALEIEVDARAASGLTPIEPLDSAGF